MKLIVNGDTLDIAEGETLEALLGRFGSRPDRVAAVVNDEMVPADLRRGRVLLEGDRVEIIVFGGGG